MPGHLLLTGFEPFGGELLHNPSIALAEALQGERIGGLTVVAQTLPCIFAHAPQVLDTALARWSPELVLALGQAGGRCDLSLERVAINLIDARIPDNAGAQPVDEPVLPGGPAAYFTGLPVKAMVAAARAVGVPASVSHSAGSFVCNQVFYALQHRMALAAAAAAATAGADLRLAPVRSGFLHLPLLPEQASGHPGQPSMPLVTMVTGLRAMLIAALRQGEGDLHVSEGSTH